MLRIQKTLSARVSLVRDSAGTANTMRLNTKSSVTA